MLELTPMVTWRRLHIPLKVLYVWNLPRFQHTAAPFLHTCSGTFRSPRRSRRHVWPLKWRPYDRSKRRELLTSRHGVTFQNNLILGNSAVRTSDIECCDEVWLKECAVPAARLIPFGTWHLPNSFFGMCFYCCTYHRILHLLETNQIIKLLTT